MKYSDLVEVYEKLEKTTKRLEKTYLISLLLKKTSEEDLDTVILLLQGKLFPVWDETKTGVSESYVIKAISIASGVPAERIKDEWRKTGDLGLVAEKLIQKKTQSTLFSQDLSISKVFNNLRKISTVEGMGSVDQKVKLIAELLTSAKSLEAKYIVRTVLEELRVGVASGTLRDAIAWAYLWKIDYDEKEKATNIEDRDEYNEVMEKVQDAYNKCNDYALVAKAAKKGLKSLDDVTLLAGKPVQVMLAQKEDDVPACFKRVGRPAALEYKYDGFRMQIHKTDGRINLFTRRLEEVTKQFPEVVEFVKKHIKAESFILDSEAVGFDAKTGRYLPFQSISQRIRRKYNIHELSQKFPVEINIFDIIYYNGKNVLKLALQERFRILEKIVSQQPRKIVLAKHLVTGSDAEAEKFYKEALAKGCEGLMFKNLDAIYKPGSRVGYMIKLKPVMETLDLVIVGAEWGEGKRSGWLTSFTIACRQDDELAEVGKVGTGIKELEGSGLSFNELTEMLKPLVITTKGKEVRVKPRIVLEIAYEEIQKSPTYKSGFALRFPRVVRDRSMEKGPEDASSIKQVKELYGKQRK